MIRPLLFKGSYELVVLDKLVKASNLRWLSKKLHIGGVQFLYDFGVHTVRRNDRKIANNEQDEEFLRHHHIQEG